MRKIIALLMIASTSVFAYQDDDYNSSSQNENSYEMNSKPSHSAEAPACQAPIAPQTPAYTAPARTNVCGAYDIYLSGTFLYWQASEEALELAFTVAANPNGSDNFDILNDITDELVGFDFKYKPAFRLDLGYNFNYDDWTLNLRYTRFNFAETSTVNKPSNKTIRPKWLEIGGVFTIANTISLKSNWKLDFNIFDLDLSRTFYEGKQLSCKTIFGLQGGWINQKYSQRGFFRDIDLTLLSYNSTNSWLIGPRAGLDGKWHLGQGVSILGNAAASVFMQKYYDIITQHSNVHNPAIFLRNDKSDKEMLINTSFEFQIGLHYGTYFNKNKYHFDVFAAYEAQFYSAQNEMRTQYDSISTSTDRGYSYPSHLGMHGLTLSARFDF